jgi:hypothetical protein
MPQYCQLEQLTARTISGSNTTTAPAPAKTMAALPRRASTCLRVVRSLSRISSRETISSIRGRQFLDRSIQQRDQAFQVL